MSRARQRDEKPESKNLSATRCLLRAGDLSRLPQERYLGDARRFCAYSTLVPGCIYQGSAFDGPECELRKTYVEPRRQSYQNVDDHKNQPFKPIRFPVGNGIVDH